MERLQKGVLFPLELKIKIKLFLIVGITKTQTLLFPQYSLYPISNSLILGLTLGVLPTLPAQSCRMQGDSLECDRKIFEPLLYFQLVHFFSFVKIVAK